MSALPFPTITNAAYALDGGSITLWLRDEQEDEHKLLLVQHLMPEQRSPDRKPGRLYLDGRLIDVRYPEEAAILAFLEIAPTSAPEHGAGPSGSIPCAGDDLKAFFGAVETGPAAVVRHLAKEVVAFVRSDEYRELAAADNGA